MPPDVPPVQVLMYVLPALNQPETLTTTVPVPPDSMTQELLNVKPATPAVPPVPIPPLV